MKDVWKRQFFYYKDLERMEDEEREGPNMVETIFFLAKYFREQKRFEEAEVNCTHLMNYTGPVIVISFSYMLNQNIFNPNITFKIMSQS